MEQEMPEVSRFFGIIIRMFTEIGEPLKKVPPLKREER
jgi:hypothetical protein